MQTPVLPYSHERFTHFRHDTLALGVQADQDVPAVHHVAVAFHQTHTFFMVAVDIAKVLNVARHEGLRGPGARRIRGDVLVFISGHQQCTCCSGIVSRMVLKGLSAASVDLTVLRWAAEIDDFEAGVRASNFMLPCATFA